MKTKAIFLHGTGSIGKTSIAIALQESLDEPYLHVGFDLFVPMMPAPYILEGRKAQEGITFKIDETGKPAFQVGSVGKKFLSGITDAISALAKQGNNIIIDEVIVGEKHKEYVLALEFCWQIHVGLYAPIEIIEKREKARGDRRSGQARPDYERVHEGKKYDIKINTDELSPQECAERIKKYIIEKYCIRKEK